MADGHFRIGDLTFSYDGDLTELAEIQSLMREFRSAEGRLKAASGAKKVVLIYDQDLEGEQGTFDRMRLRAYSGEKNYTLDIGNTDNNPLGVYVGYAQPIRVYDREQGRAYYLDRAGNEHDTEEAAKQAIQEGDTQQSGASSSAGQESEGKAAGSQNTQGASSPEDSKLMSTAEALVNKFSDAEPDTSAREIEIEGTPLQVKVQRFAKWAGRSAKYINRIWDVKGVETFGGLVASEAADAIRMIADEQRLEDAETVQNSDDELPI